MQRAEIEAKVTEIATPIALEHGCEIVDVEYVKEGQEKYLKIFIDKEGGVAINDCADVSRAINPILEENDFIKEKHILEVSSPGLDRPLKKDADFEKYAGKIVDIKLYKKVDGEKEYQEELVGLVDGKVVVKKEDGTELVFAREDIAIIRLAVLF